MIGQMMIWRKVNVPPYIICFFYICYLDEIYYFMISVKKVAFMRYLLSKCIFGGWLGRT